MNDWIEWSSERDDPPVTDTLVMVKFRGSPEIERGPCWPDNLFWFHDGRSDDIIAYKVVS